MPLYPYSVYQNPKFYRKRLNQTCPEYFWSQFLCPKVDYQFLIPSNSDWDFTYFKRFNNCYILLLNSPQTIENTGFVAGELSLIVSLVLYRPTSVYEL